LNIKNLNFAEQIKLFSFDSDNSEKINKWKNDLSKIFGSNKKNNDIVFEIKKLINSDVLKINESQEKIKKKIPNRKVHTTFRYEQKTFDIISSLAVIWFCKDLSKSKKSNIKTESLKISVMLDRTKHTTKPSGQQTGYMVKNHLMKPVTVTIQELAQELSSGATFRPALLRESGTKDEDWLSQSIFAAALFVTD